MGLVTREVWECDVCKWVWIPRKDVRPSHCPNPKCRSRRWDSGTDARGIVRHDDEVVSQGVGARDRLVSERKRGNRGTAKDATREDGPRNENQRLGKVEEVIAEVKKRKGSDMPDGLKPSEQMRWMREHS